VTGDGTFQERSEGKNERDALAAPRGHSRQVHEVSDHAAVYVDPNSWIGIDKSDGAARVLGSFVVRACAEGGYGRP